MFGQEAAELLNYVECFPNGFKKGSNMALECSLVKIEGFPMWVINGQVSKLPFAMQFLHSGLLFFLSFCYIFKNSFLILISHPKLLLIPTTPVTEIFS